ncbi:uncharacterized protein METZ01_LOCUS198386, partial [marine metagenome]
VEEKSMVDQQMQILRPETLIEE